jgi:oligopeptidase B
MAGVLDAPRAAKKPYIIKAPHGKEREDPYYWLRDDSRSDQEIMDYLQV